MNRRVSMKKENKQGYTHTCYLCGKPSTSHTCRECFKKGKRNAISRTKTRRRYERNKRNEKL